MYFNLDHTALHYQHKHIMSASFISNIAFRQAGCQTFCWSSQAGRQSWPSGTFLGPVGLFFALWDFYLPSRTFICPAGLLFAQWEFICPVGLFFSQWYFSLPSGTFICPVGLLLAQWDFYSPSGTFLCPVGLLFATGFSMALASWAAAGLALIQSSRSGIVSMALASWAAAGLALTNPVGQGLLAWL
jgi:hypothetical protein